MDNLVQKKNRHLRFCPKDFSADSFTTKLRNKHVDVLHPDKVIRDLARNKEAILATRPRQRRKPIGELRKAGQAMFRQKPDHQRSPIQRSLAA
jgi:hypothetical protein